MDMSPDPIRVELIGTLDPQPGETVVCRIDEKTRLPGEALLEIREHLDRVFPDNQSIVLVGDIALYVTNAPPPPPPSPTPNIGIPEHRGA